MANYTKHKIGLTLISIFIIVFIHLFNNGFYRTYTLKKWSKLTWDDFDGMVKPFSKHDASISYEFCVEYDEKKEKYYSFVEQNNVFSWKRKSVNNDSLLLRHEQYHFDIAEYHARLMNKYLEKEVPEEESGYRLEFKKISSLMRGMQKKYDKETEHSTNVENQKLWETKIDSLLGKNKRKHYKK